MLPFRTRLCSPIQPIGESRSRRTVTQNASSDECEVHYHFSHLSLAVLLGFYPLTMLYHLLHERNVTAHIVYCFCFEHVFSVRTCLSVCLSVCNLYSVFCLPPFLFLCSCLNLFTRLCLSPLSFLDDSLHMYVPKNNSIKPLMKVNISSDSVH